METQTDIEAAKLDYALAKQIPAMEKGFTLSTSYGDIEIAPDEATAFIRAARLVISRRLKSEVKK